MKERILLLFDIDGTLVAGGHSVHGRSMEYAVAHHTGRDTGFHSIDYAGRTDAGIFRAMLDSMGYDGEAQRRMMGEIFHTMVHHHREHEGDIRDAVFAGVHAALPALAARGDMVMGLLTGNHEQVAWHKLARAGIAHHFSMGAFGNEAVDRPDLIPIAAARAQERYGTSFSGRQIVIIGDTPRDVACGKAHGAMTVAMTTGPFDAAALEACGPDLVLSDLADYQRLCALLPACPLTGPSCTGPCR